MNATDSIFRIDLFDCPATAVSEFEQRLRFIHEFLGAQPGCLYNKVVVSQGDDHSRIVTMIEWADEASIAAAKSAAADLYREAGFDPKSFMSERGIVGDFGTYRSLVTLPEPA